MTVLTALTTNFYNLNTIFLLLFILLVFFCMIYYVHDDEQQIIRKNQLSKLPCITKNIWENIVFSIKVARLTPREYIPFFFDLFKKHGSIIYFRIMMRNYVALNNPNDIMVLLSSTKHITKGPEYKLLEPWLNQGLLTSSGNKWRSRRKLLTHTFHFKILESYISIFNKHSQSLMKNLISASENHGPIKDINSLVTLCALDIVCETIMGVNIQSQEGKSKDYVKAVISVSSLSIDRIAKFWLWNEKIFNLSKNGRDFHKSLKILHDFTENVIKEKREKLDSKKNLVNENGTKKIYSFLELLIDVSKENPDIMTDKDIREEVDTFLFEGHDTSSIVLTMTLIHLGLNQYIQQNVRDELNAIFGNSDREARLEDLKSMTYLERVIKETMRLYPSVTAISRKLKQPLYLEKYTIPANTYIAISPHMLHRTESIYPNPEEFNPDRFIPDQCLARHPYAYIPFSAGPRNCIGQKFAMNQIKCVVSTILRHIKLETLGSQNDLIISTRLIMKAKVPDLKITSLNNNNNY
ncbi:cytochrome P450 4C1-like [Daktulosphaira vitifoliae]|uniref:cytochrome P450 4C1-like n=1 Tax=Daktulosphaira vitifoliae TaxID=58002 RepID=UPI0021AA1719|nr:cytochrome P450 4C1-like [Daktulosphaira vitifoliae]